jgi:hypothetical protein
MVFAEARVMLDGEHDNVVRVFSADTETGIPVIRMEYLPAGSVADRYCCASVHVCCLICCRLLREIEIFGPAAPVR